MNNIMFKIDLSAQLAAQNNADNVKLFPITLEKFVMNTNLTKKLNCVDIVKNLLNKKIHLFLRFVSTLSAKINLSLLVKRSLAVATFVMVMWENNIVHLVLMRLVSKGLDSRKLEMTIA
mmetsp:Transcript_17228/g.19633  ORF Transcript_17228/g.19633 Transcript_17228/m.19633 type:complete len:119 (-) Transcript_17228:424-780(-)